MISKYKKHFSEIKKALYIKDYKYLKYYINSLPNKKKDNSYIEFLYIILNINSNSFKRKVLNEIEMEYNEVKDYKEKDIKLESLIEGKEYFRLGLHKKSQEYKLLFDYFLSNISSYRYKCLFFYHVNIFKDYSLLLQDDDTSNISRLSRLKIKEHSSEYEKDMSSSIEYLLKKVLYRITIITNNNDNNENDKNEDEDVAYINKEISQVLNIISNNSHISNLDINEIYIISIIYRLINKYHIDLISKVILNKTDDYLTFNMNLRDHLYLSLSNKKRLKVKKYIYKFYSTEILYEKIRNLKEVFEKKYKNESQQGENSQIGNIFKVDQSKNEIFDYVIKYIPLLFNQNKDYKLIYNIVKNILLLNERQIHIENKLIIEDLLGYLLINKTFLYENYTFNQYFYYLKLTTYLISYKDNRESKNIIIKDINYEIINRLLSIMSIILEPPFENTSFSLYENVILVEKIVNLLEFLFKTSHNQLLNSQSKIKFSLLIEINQLLEKYNREISTTNHKEAYLVSRYKKISEVYKEIILKIRLSFVMTTV